MRMALDLAEQKHLAVDWLQRAERTLQRQAKRMVVGRRRQVERRVGVERLFAAGLSAPADVVADVEEDAIDPCPERRIPFERLPAAVRAEKRILDRVLRVGLISQHVERQALHPRPMRGKERLESRQVSRHVEATSSRLGQNVRHVLFRLFDAGTPESVRSSYAVGSPRLARRQGRGGSVIDGFGFGLPEMTLLFMLGIFGIIPWIAGIWALVTLYRIKTKVEAIERHLKA